MQGTKLPRSKLWIAGVSSVAILAGCGSETLRDNANSNTAPTESEAKVVGQEKRKGEAGTTATAESPAPIA